MLSVNITGKVCLDTVTALHTVDKGRDVCELLTHLLGSLHTLESNLENTPEGQIGVAQLQSGENTSVQ